MEQVPLEKTYYDPEDPAGFSGATRLLQKHEKKIPRKDIHDWLNAQNTYTLHKPIRRRFPRLHYNVDTIDDVWEADLIDLQKFKSYNDDVSYLLTVIDVVSKYAWVEPLTDKSGQNVRQAFERIFDQGRKPRLLQTDRGKEFVADTVQNLLKEKDISYRAVRNPDIKAAIVERFNRTLKERMWRFFTYAKNRRYIDVLQQFVKAYNNTRHNTIKMTPASVTLANAYIALNNIDKVHQRLDKKLRPRPFKYKVNDYVRISKTKGAFEKGYESNYSDEIFKIIRVRQRQLLPTYELEDLSGEDIDGFFYEEELTLVNKNINTEEYEIEEVIRTKGKGKNKQVLVKWVGYPHKFNLWIPASNVVDIQKFTKVKRKKRKK